MYVRKGGVSFRGRPQGFITYLHAGDFLAHVLSPSLKLCVSSAPSQLSLSSRSGLRTCPRGEDRQLLPSNPFICHACMPSGKYVCKLKCVGSREQDITPPGAYLRDAAMPGPGGSAEQAGHRAAGSSPRGPASPVLNVPHGRVGVNCEDHPFPLK